LNKSVSIKKEKLWTETFKVYLPASGIQDKLTSLDIQVSLFRKLHFKPTLFVNPFIK